MTTYTAWDGKEYPKPTPAGWYLGADGRWWPPDHGPGPSEVPPVAAPEAAPVVAPNAQTAVQGSGGGSGKVLIGVVLVVLLLGGIVVALLAGGESDPVSETATTVFRTETTSEGAPETSTDPNPTASSTTTVAPPGKGSIEDPYALGDVVTIQYTDITEGEERVWEIEVTGAVSDQTDAVLAENQFNDAPPDGFRFAVAPIRVTYISGPAPASLFDLNFKALGPSAVVLTTFDPSCGVVPNALDTLAEAFPGGTLEGNICWVAKPSDIEELTMLIEIFLVDGETFVELH